MFSNPDIHYIQREIIQSLANSSPLRFSELQPARIPNNTFSYHLKKLLEAGYITHNDKGYVATRKALKIVSYSSYHDRRKEVPTFISVVYVTDPEGRVLLLKRRNKPFADWYGIPSGLIHRGEKLEAAAERELFEKTGVHTKKPLEFVGTLDFRYLDSESRDVFIHAVAFVYKYKCLDINEIQLDKETKYGELDWSRLTRDKILPEVRAITELVSKGSTGIVSVDFDEPLLS